jgi:hypothetical protein
VAVCAARRSWLAREWACCARCACWRPPWSAPRCSHAGTSSIYLVQDVQAHATRGLDNASALFDQERLRSLNNAELAASRLGPVVAQQSPDDLLKAVADTRANALRSTSLVALVDVSGHTLASDPASNLQFANQGDIKAALQGKLAAGWQERTPLALESTAPLPAADGAVLVAENVDDTLLNAGAKLTSEEMALVQNGRIVSASRGIRRSLTFASDTSADPDLLAQSGDAFDRTSVGPDAYYLAARPITLSNGKVVGTLLAGTSAQPIDTRCDKRECWPMPPPCWARSAPA